jgi:predicted secreted protein
MRARQIISGVFSLSLLLASSLAKAADGATLGFMAYSPDTHYFAFEQLGVEDGSGSAYAEIFVLDLEKNTWLGNSPFREKTQEDSASLVPTRAAAMAKAAPLLKQFGIAEPAELVVVNPATEVIADRRHVQFDRYFLSSQQGSMPQGDVPLNELRFELQVETNAATAPPSCPTEDGTVYGFTLKLKSLKSGLITEVHKDKTIPESRQCPVGYDIAAVVAPMNYPKIERLVAIVGVYSFGFEGSNRRYVAVPFTLQ